MSTIIETELAPIVERLPARRLGSLLWTHRREAGIAALPAAQAAGITVSELDDIECGRRAATAGTLARLLACYGVASGDIMHPRRPLVVTVPEGAGRDEILRAHIEAVREWRKTGSRGELRLRHDDVVTLTNLLGRDAEEIERRLIELTGCRRSEAKLLRNLLLTALAAVPAVGGVVGVAGLGGGGQAAAAPRPAAVVAPRPAAVVARSSDSQGAASPSVNLPVPLSASVAPATAAVPVVGVLQPSLSRVTSTRAAGIASVVFAVHWSSFAPVPGAVDQQYVSQIRAQIGQYTSAGMKVILSPGLQNPPDWVFALNSSTRFVDQHGNVWQGGPGENVPDAVFDAAVRQAQTDYLAQLGNALNGMPIYSVRAGGLLDGELRYPSAGLHNSYWAFSATAQAQSPVPGWRPGDHGIAQAAKFAQWYLGSLTSYQNFLVTATGNAFPSSRVMVLYPAWGVRLGEVAQAVASGLNGSSPAEKNGSLQEGLDWASQVATAPNVAAGTTIYTTNLAAPDQGTGPTGEAPVYYLAALARSRHLSIAGENAGAQSEAILSRCVQRAMDLGLTDMLWMNEGALYSAGPGLPNLTQLGQAFTAFK